MTTTVGSRTSLHISASEGATQVTQILLGAGASVHACAASDWTPLHFSAREGHVDICRMLIIKASKDNSIFLPYLCNIRINYRREGDYVDTFS